MQAIVEYDTIVVEWNDPFLLPGLKVSYTVSVYLGDTVSVHNMSSTGFKYDLADNGIYKIQVVSFNGTITSEAATTYVTYCTSMSMTMCIVYAMHVYTVEFT